MAQESAATASIWPFALGSLQLNLGDQFLFIFSKVELIKEPLILISLGLHSMKSNESRQFD